MGQGNIVSGLVHDKYLNDLETAAWLQKDTIDAGPVRQTSWPGGRSSTCRRSTATQQPGTISRQMSTPIDTVSIVFHERGLGPYPMKPQAEWDMCPRICAPISHKYQCSWHLCLFCHLKPFNEGTTMLSYPIEYSHILWKYFISLGIYPRNFYMLKYGINTYEFADFHSSTKI